MRTFVATAAAANAKGAAAAAFNNAIVLGSTRESEAAGTCKTNSWYGDDGRIHVVFKPNLLLMFVSFLAGLAVMFVIFKLVNRCSAKKPKITEACMTIAGEKIHVDKKCAERLSSSKLVNKSFCLLCNYYATAD